MTYIAAWSNPSQSWLNTGRNSTKPSEMQRALADYANEDTEVGDQDIVNASDMFELADMLDLVIVTSNQQFTDDTPFDEEVTA